MNIEALKAYLAGGHNDCNIAIKEHELRLINKARLNLADDILKINAEIDKIEVVQRYIEDLWKRFPELMNSNQ
jgi:hypothetical protein